MCTEPWVPFLPWHEHSCCCVPIYNPHTGEVEAGRAELQDHPQASLGYMKPVSERKEKGGGERERKGGKKEEKESKLHFHENNSRDCKVSTVDMGVPNEISGPGGSAETC